MPRPYPTSVTGRLQAARRYTHAAFSERNLLLRLLACHYDSHIMPVTGNLTTLDQRAVLCLHTKEEGPIAFIIDATELAAFDGIPQLSESHWDGATRAIRDERILALIKGMSGAKPWKSAKPTALPTAPHADLEPRPRRRRRKTAK